MFAIRREVLQKLLQDSAFLKELEKCRSDEELVDLIFRFAKKYSFKVKGFRRYDFFYYCRKCGIWIRKDKVEYAKNGMPICPKCHNYVRVKPRNK